MGRLNEYDRVLDSSERQLLKDIMDGKIDVEDVDDWDMLCDMDIQTEGTKFSRKKIKTLNSYMA